ncbi:MAG: hypothetical protein AB4057_03705 [Crocosphaera sp.]
MFVGKFVEAATITLVLYICLQSSSVSISYGNFLSFKASRFEQLFLSNLQEDFTYNRWWFDKDKEKFEPEVQY